MPEMMDIEEIDDNCSEEVCPPATTVTTKKRGNGKSKKESPAVAAASSTLTRFLGPAGPPSLSAWEDVNRQCPVCQQTGFSSRSLALHVNECLDVGRGRNAGAEAADNEDEATGASARERASRGAGAAGGRNAPTAASARRAGNVGASNVSHAAGAGSRQGQGVARKMPQDRRAVPSKSKAPVSISVGKAAKKAKTQQDRRGTAAAAAAAGRQRPGDSTSTVSQGCGQATDKARSGAPSASSSSSLQPSLLDSNHSPAGVAQQHHQYQHQHQHQPTPLRRRGLGLARPTRGQPTSSDAAPTPTAAKAVSGVPNGSVERVLNEIARAQLSYAQEQEASASRSASAPQAGKWLGTQLFPKLDGEDSLVDDQCADCCCDRTATGGAQGACLASCGANADTNANGCAAGRGDREIAANENSRVRVRVRPRPASWGARPSSEHRGWLGIWPGGVGDNDDSCSGDGDGYLTLRPFPSVAEPTPTGVQAGDGNSSAVVQAGAAQSLSSKGQGQGSSSALSRTWRADRFLQVFSRLQPARRALNLHLHVSPPPPPPPSPKAKASEGRCAEVEGAGAPLPPRIAAGDADADGNGDGDGRGDAGGDARYGDAGGDGGDGDGDGDGRQGVAIPRRQDSLTAVKFGEGEAKAEAGGTAGSCEVGSVVKLSTPLPKRAALRTLRLPSTGVGSAVKQRSSASINVNINSVPDRSRAGPPSSSAHCNSLGPTSTSVVNTSGNTSVNRVNLTRQGPPKPKPKPKPKPPSPTKIPAVPPTSAVEKSSGIGCLVSNPLANIKGVAEETSLAMAAASVPSAPHPPGATSAENVATGVSKRPKSVTVTTNQLRTPGGAGGGAPPRNGSSGKSGRMIGRLAGASVAVKRASTSTSRESESEKSEGALASKAKAKAEADEGSQRGEGDSHAAPVFSRWGGSRSRGPLACRASSGLLRSADCASVSASASVPASASGVPDSEPKLAPASSGMRVDPSASDASQQQQQEQEQEAFQGREADVRQKGSLTVVCDHGATLRSSWSIDDSQEVGRLVFGASLDYDAVWYLDPADGDCIGVLRYRILPHPLLAPTGGWISERGRLRDDPYVIVKATPTPAPTPASSSSSSSSRTLSSSSSSFSDRHRRPGAGETQAQAPLGRRHPAAPRQQKQHQHQRQHQHQGIAGSEGLAKSPIQQGLGSSRYPPGAGGSHGERASAPTTTSSSSSPSLSSSSSSPMVGGGRRTQPKPQTQPQTASKVFVLPGAGAAPGRGSFGIATSPSAKALEASDTGDKVTCPVCNRGMDHWKSGQRQQHVHTCLLKQSSSAKKTPPAAAIAATPAPRTPGNGKRYVGTAGSGYGNRASGGVEGTGPSALALGQERQERESPGPSGTSGGTADSPRSTRVSLQGVFSPKAKPARGPVLSGAGHGPSRSEHRRDNTSSLSSSRKEGMTPTPTLKSGAGISLATKTNTNGSRAYSRGAAQVRVPANESTSTSTSTSTVPPKAEANAKAPAECPVCQLRFGGRLVEWERQQHIQQCLESLGVFD